MRFLEAVTPLDLDSPSDARGLDAARRVLASRPADRREPLWRPLLAAALAAVAALALCAAVFSQGPAQGDAASGPAGVREALATR